MIDWFEVIGGIVFILVGALFINIGYRTNLGLVFLPLGGYHLGKRTMDRKGKIVMSEEERKVIEQCRLLLAGDIYLHIIDEDDGGTAYTGTVNKEYNKDLETVLNLVETQNKMIELMTRKLNEAYFEENNYWLWFEKEICPKENGKYKFGCIAERVVKLKKYFRNKAKESE